MKTMLKHQHGFLHPIGSVRITLHFSETQDDGEVEPKEALMIIGFSF
jgi:hypothetical protein